MEQIRRAAGSGAQAREPAAGLRYSLLGFLLEKALLLPALAVVCVGFGPLLGCDGPAVPVVGLSWPWCRWHPRVAAVPGSAVHGGQAGQAGVEHDAVDGLVQGAV
ncbi:hypothetical protein ACFXP3_12965, partial [Streptomyces sp. NPDC059096]|uniref:hypothetical protein n=1 Tax=Streptomyces sp. NPDC059096 TaxID=3346727 RepID=UPI003695CBEB